MTSGDVDSIGLWLDIIGAFFLAESFVLKRRTETARESTSYLDGNPFTLRSASYQAVEARVGFSFLALGFVGQLLSQTDLVSPAPARSPICLAIAAVGVFIIAFGIMRSCARRFSRRVIAKEWKVMLSELQDSRHSAEKLHELACFYGTSLDLKPKDGERNEAFVARVTRNLQKWG